MIRDTSSPGETIKYKILRQQGAKASRSLTSSFSSEVSSVSTSFSTGSSSKTSLHETAQTKHYEGIITGGSTGKEGREMVKTLHEKIESQEGRGVIAGVKGITGAQNGAQSQISLPANGSASAQFSSSSQSRNQASSSAKTESYSSMQTTFTSSAITSQTSTASKTVSGQATRVGVMREGLKESSGEASRSLDSGQESQLDMIQILKEENRQLKLKLASLGVDSAQVGGASVSSTSASGQISWDADIKALQGYSKDELIIKITHLLEEHKTLKIQSEYVTVTTQSSKGMTETDGKYVAAQGKVEGKVGHGGAMQINKEVMKGTSTSLQAQLDDVTQLYNRILTEKNQLTEELERFKASQKQVEEMKTKIKNFEEEKMMLTTLKSENSSLKTEKTKAEEEKVAKIEELKGLQQMLTTLKLENENLQAQNAKIGNKKAGNKSAQGDTASLSVEVGSLKEEKAKMEKDRATLLIKVEKLTALEGEMEKIQKQVSSLQSENKSLKEKTAGNKDTDIKKVYQELKSLKTQNTKLEEEKGSLLAEAQDNSMLQGEIDDLKYQLNSLISENTILTAEKTNMQKEVSTKVEDEKKKLQHELDTLKNNNQAVTVKRLQGELDALTLKMENMKGEKAKLELQVGNTGVKKVHEELSSLKGENEILKTKIAQLQGGQGSVLAGAQKSVKGGKKNTSQEFTTFQTTSQVVTVTNTQGDMTTLLLENESLKNEKAMLERERDSLLAKEEKLTTLEGEMKKMQQEVSTLHTENAGLKEEQAAYVGTDVKKVRVELKALKSENDVLKTQKTKLQEETGNLLAEVQKNTDVLGKMEKVQSQVKTLVSENEVLKTEKTKVMKDEAKKAEEERKRLQQELATLRNTDQEAIIARMERELTALKLETESLKTEKDKSERERTALTTKVDGMKRMGEELSSLQSEVRALKLEKVANKQVDVKKLQKDLASLQTENKTMKAEKGKVQEEKRSLVVETQEKMKIQVRTLEKQLTVLRSENEVFKEEKRNLKEKEAARMSEERKKLQEEMAKLKITYQEGAEKKVQAKLESLLLENESLKQDKAKLERERANLSGETATEVGGASFMVQTKTTTSRREVQKTKESASFRSEAKGLNEIEVIKEEMEGGRATASQLQGRSAITQDVTKLQKEIASLRAENQSMKAEMSKLKKVKDTLLSRAQTLTLTEVREVANTQQTTIISESSSQVTIEKEERENVDLSKEQEATDSTLERIKEEMSTLQTLLEEKDELHDADDAGGKQDTTDSRATSKNSDSASFMKEIETLKSQVATLRNEKEKYETLVMGKWQVIDLQGDGALQLLQEENRKLRAYIEENDMQIAAMQTAGAVQVQKEETSTSSSSGKQGSQSTEEENKMLKKQIEEMQQVQGNLMQSLGTKLEESSANITRMQLLEMEVTQLYQVLQQHGVSKEDVKITTSVADAEDAVQSVEVTQKGEVIQTQTTKSAGKSSKLSRLEEEAAKMAQKRKKLQQELASLKTEYQEEGAAKTVVHSQKSETVLTQTQEVHSQKSTSETVLTQTTQGTLKTSLSMELEEEMSSLKTKLQDYERLQTELADTKKELAKLTKDKNSQEKSKKAAKESQATQEKIDMLQMQVKELTLQVRILSTSKSDLDDTRKKLAELQKENTSLSGQLGNMKAMEREVTIARSVIQQLKEDNEKMALKMKKSKK